MDQGSSQSPNDPSQASVARRLIRHGFERGSVNVGPFRRTFRISPIPRDLVTLASIGVTLAGAVVVDAVVKPREQFVSSPFAVPVLIAAERLSSPGIAITGAITMVVAAVAGRLNRSPAPTAFHLLGLGIISFLAYRLGEQRRATVQQAREAEVERMRVQAILQSTVNAIVYVDVATGNVMANPSAVRLFGHPFVPEAGRSQFVPQVRTPDGHAVDLEQLPSSLALQGVTPPQKELVIARPDGTQIPVLVSASPVCDPDDHVIGAVIVYQDISSLKELEELRQEWTSMIAHDLRQPVTVITAYADRLRSLLVNHGSPDERRAVAHVLSSAGTLNQMVADLLDVSRLQTFHLTLQRQVTDIPSLVRAVVERRDLAPEDHLVRVATRGEIPLLEIDPIRVEQVLSNLLSNAAKYGYPNTEIRVEVERQNQDVQVSVTNRGEGIPPDELSRIFSPFYRTRKARAGQVAGIGLGLTIAKGLVEAHGGRIWAESVPGQTTTFHFTLPIAASTADR